MLRKEHLRKKCVGSWMSSVSGYWRNSTTRRNIATRLHPPGKEVVNGESAPYLGRDYRIEVTETVSSEIEFSQLFLVPPARQAKRREVLRDWYIARAKEKIITRAEQHARELGVEFAAAKIVDNRYRWGSCTVNSNVSFNWRLIKAPMFVIDYVIVHELAHLIETNHTSRFWSIVRANIPTMEKAKACISEHGQVLEEEGLDLQWSAHHRRAPEHRNLPLPLNLVLAGGTNLPAPIT